MAIIGSQTHSGHVSSHFLRGSDKDITLILGYSGLLPTVRADYWMASTKVEITNWILIDGGF